MTKDEALRLALEALEDLGNHDRVCPQWPTYAEPENYPKCNCGYDQAITAIKAALEAKDEPVGYFSVNDYGNWEENESNNGTPLYTNPPQRKPLTDEEIKSQWSVFWEADCHPWAIDFARAIEAKLKEKNT